MKAKSSIKEILKLGLSLNNIKTSPKSKEILSYAIASKNLRDEFEKRNLNEIEIKNLPKPSSMLGLNEASAIIASSILENKKIGIVGDYDVDGVSSSCIVTLFFQKLGFSNFKLKIPNRFIDGYGINKNIIDSLDAEVYITLDNGITAFEVAEYCKERNKILIITDHHKPREEGGIDILPNANVIVNPSQKKCGFVQKEVCGAVVAWYLCAGIKERLGRSDIKMQDFTPFLSLAIISDVMPLTSLNRTLFKMGIRKINSKDSSICAFDILKEKFGTQGVDNKVDSKGVGFYIAPLLNAAGRLRDASLAYNFLLESDTKEARRLFSELIAINEERKQIQNEVFLKASGTNVDSKVIIAYGEGWHEGVLGIVASKLAEQFGKCAFCLNLDSNILKGSGRSYGGVNLIASISSCSNLLLSFGGHSGAVGLKLELENLPSFVQTLEQNLVLDSSIEEDFTPFFISLNAININLLELLESYEPYGNANESIIFHANDIKVLDSRIVGANHQILIFKNKLEAILFNDTRDYKNSNVDIAFYIERGRYNPLQLRIVDISRRD